MLPYSLALSLLQEDNSRGVVSNRIKIITWAYWVLGWFESKLTKNQTILNIIGVLSWWVDGTIVSSTKHLMFHVLFFFHNFLQNSLKKTLSIYFCIALQKKEFWVPLDQASNPLFYFQSIKTILGSSDAWLMRQTTQQPSVLYWRPSDFKCNHGCKADCWKQSYMIKVGRTTWGTWIMNTTPLILPF